MGNGRSILALRLLARVGEQATQVPRLEVLTSFAGRSVEVQFGRASLAEILCVAAVIIMG